MDRTHVLAVQRLDVNPEGFSAASNFSGSGFAIMGVFVVLIVLTDIDDRQFPKRRHVHGLVKQSLAKRAVAEKTHSHLIAAAHFNRHCRAGSDAGAATDNGVGAQVSSVLVGNMHGAAFATAVAGFLTEQLGEHSISRCALGNAMAMSTVRTGNVIVSPQRFANANSHSFLADVKMRESRHLGAEVKLINLFFEQPDLQHLTIEAQP